jgi:hypothetical protein
MQPASEAFNIGKRLELGVGRDLVEWLPTRVEDNAADGRISVAWPTDPDRRLARILTGETVQVMVTAARDARYATGAAATQPLY